MKRVVNGRASPFNAGVRRNLFQAVIRGFPRDDYVVYVTLTQARLRNADELAVFPQLFQICGAAIAHPAAQAAAKRQASELARPDRVG